MKSALAHSFTGSCEKVNAAPVRRSAGKVNGAVLSLAGRLPADVLAFEDAAKRLVWAALPGASLNAKGEAAAHLGLCSPDTIYRIAEGHVSRLDARLMFALLVQYQARRGCAFDFGAGLSVMITQVSA